METIAELDQSYLLVRRVIAAIAFANDEFDDAERELLASEMAGEYRLSPAQVEEVLEDAVSRRPPGELVAQITDPLFIRQVIFDLLKLAIAKQEWTDAELGAARSTILALNVPPQAAERVSQAFEALLGLEV